jgi:hypothetical protein
VEKFYHRLWVHCSVFAACSKLVVQLARQIPMGSFEMSLAEVLNNLVTVIGIVQCDRKFALHLQKLLEVMSTSVYTDLKPFQQLNTSLLLQFNRCLTTEYSETTAYFNGNTRY